jgi:hypothetical protein
MLEMAGVFEFGERKFPVDREVEFAGIGGKLPFLFGRVDVSGL